MLREEAGNQLPPSLCTAAPAQLMKASRREALSMSFVGLLSKFFVSREQNLVDDQGFLVITDHAQIGAAEGGAGVAVA